MRSDGKNEADSRAPDRKRKAKGAAVESMSPDLNLPLQNVPAFKKSLGRWTIEGYSRAAVQTYWRINEMKIGFDCGAHPWDFMGLPRLFITHSHLDHIAALPVYVARRRMMKMEPPIVYLPESAVDATAALLRVFARLDRGKLPCELVGLKPGDEVEVSRELLVTAHPTRHTVPSLGYVVWERRKKLKPEYVDFSGDQIRDIRLSGVEVSHEVRLPAIAYTGDTAPDGLDACREMFEAEVLITELTFLSPHHRKEKIHKHGHMHLDDFVARLGRFRNQHIVCGHFSTRYSDSQILRWMRNAIMPEMSSIIQPWLEQAI